MYTDQELQNLIACGKQQGYLTYDRVNEYLPDEAVSPEKLDSLLTALDEQGIEILNEPPEGHSEDQPANHSKTTREESGKPPSTEELPKLSDDLLRMYLAQMSQIDLLTREEEIALAKKIEITSRGQATIPESHRHLSQASDSC